MVVKVSACEVLVVPTIVLSDVRKRYGNGVEAIRGISMSVHRGEIFCVLGPNGAGKTTLLRIMGTQLEPTSGAVRILGFDALREPETIREHLSVVPQDVVPDPGLTPEEHVYFYLRARGLGRRAAKEDAHRTLKRLALWDCRGTVSMKLSGGLRKRILIAMAIGSGSAVMLLDEPTAGLDPLARREVWRDLLLLKVDRTIVLTTHSMEEAEALADHVAICNKGELVGIGSVAELKQKLPVQRKVCVDHGEDRGFLERFGRLEQLGDRCVVYPRDDQSTEEIIRLALVQKLAISVHPIDLEDIYVHLLKARI